MVEGGRTDRSMLGCLRVAIFLFGCVPASLYFSSVVCPGDLRPSLGLPQGCRPWPASRCRGGVPCVIAGAAVVRFSFVFRLRSAASSFATPASFLDVSPHAWGTRGGLAWGWRMPRLSSVLLLASGSPLPPHPSASLCPLRCRFCCEVPPPAGAPACPPCPCSRGWGGVSSGTFGGW